MIDIVISSPVWRSGSTLVQRMFNANPSNLIWGEHGGILSQFVDIARNASVFSTHSDDQREAFLISGTREKMWSANFAPPVPDVERAVTDAARLLLDRIYATRPEGVLRVGFKEVRYGRSELDILRKCYPESVLVLVVRDPASAWASMPEWGVDFESFIGLWVQNVAGYLELAGSPNAHLFNYDDVVNGAKNTLETLGELAGINVQRVQEVLGEKIGGTVEKRVNIDLAYIGEYCGELMTHVANRSAQ